MDFIIEIMKQIPTAWQQDKIKVISVFIVFAIFWYLTADPTKATRNVLTVIGVLAFAVSTTLVSYFLITVIALFFTS